MEKLPNQRIVSSVMERLGLRDPAFIEKDFYVTQVLHALSALKNDDFDLVFIGGTCLTKAHKVIQRMSEDIDFKLVPKNTASLNSRAAREKLSHLRQQIIHLIQKKTGLFPKEGQLMKGNNNRFTQIFLDYEAFYPTNSILRPQIKIELTAQVTLLPAERLTISSLINQTIPHHGITESKDILCTSIQETAPEKWAALGRRIADADRETKNADPSIIRHLYDLYCIDQKGITSDFETLTPQIVNRDRERFKGKSPQFYEEPLKEIQRGFNALKNTPHWKKNYHEFIQNMVFQKNPPSYEETLKTLDNLHKRAIHAIEKSPLFEKNHLKTIAIGYTEKTIKGHLRQYQRLRKTAEAKQTLSAVYALHDFSEQLTNDPSLMAYAKKNHPTVAKNIQILAQDKKEKVNAIKSHLTPKQEENFNNTLKTYQQLRKSLEKDSSNIQKEKQLTEFAHIMMHNHSLMEYTQYFYPKTAKNIYKLSAIETQNIKKDRSKKQDQTISHSI